MQIDIDSFANFNPVNNHEDTDETMADENLQNINKYLEFNNIWTLEKLAHEFKSIHSNRVAFI